MKMREIVHGRSSSELKQDIVFYSRLSNCTSIPFTPPIAKLCFEVDQHWKIGERVLTYVMGKFIMDFTPAAIQQAFQWTAEGDVEYNEVDSLACYQQTSQPATTIQSWMLEEHNHLKGNPLLNAPYSSFLLVIELIILMLSRILEKDNASKFRKEFFGFITEITKGRRIMWNKVLSNTLINQFSSMAKIKKFNLSSYLVYLLLHGKYQPSIDGDLTIWKCYLKWRIERRWESFKMMNDGWEYLIYKEIKSEVVVAKISNSNQDALKRHGDFFI